MEKNLAKVYICKVMEKISQKCIKSGFRYDIITWCGIFLTCVLTLIYLDLSDNSR